jgi:hypothetical protein
LACTCSIGSSTSTATSIGTIGAWAKFFEVVFTERSEVSQRELREPSTARERIVDYNKYT